MTKEQLSAKIMRLVLFTGTSGGTFQALGNAEHPAEWLTIGLLTGFAITLKEWREVAAILIAEYNIWYCHSPYGMAIFNRLV